jgi:glutamate-ammonia-ligase adenylyltransferase
MLIKQFTYFLTVAPDPVMALQHFDRLADRLASDAAQGVDLQWLWEDNTLKALAMVLGSSHFLWEDFLRLHYETLLPIFKDLRTAEERLSKDALTVRLQQALHGATTVPTGKDALNAYKDRELFRIDMRQLLHRDLPFGAFADELADLAEVVLAGALGLAQDRLQARYGQPRLAAGQPCTFALCGLGKLGGRELGYASDLEMLCVYSGQGQTSGPQPIAISQYAELLVQQLLDLIVARRSGTFEIDLRLRPFGSKGPLATSLDAFREYYRHGGQAAPFERQALIKLRWVAGDPAGPGTTDAKYSQGGLVDIEYLVQYLQLRHGATVPALRTPQTLTALQALSRAQIISATAYQTLHDAYVLLRRLVDALRLGSGQAHDLVIPPADTNAFILLARRMGYWEEQGTPAQLAHMIAHHMQQAARLYAAYCLSAGVQDTASP